MAITIDNWSSIITSDNTKCYMCWKKNVRLDVHHIFGASRRSASEEYKLVVPLCRECHNKVHLGDAMYMKRLHSIGQGLFEKTYRDLDFNEVMSKTYKEELESILNENDN